MVNEVKSFAYTVNSQLCIHTLAKLLILRGLRYLPPPFLLAVSGPAAWLPVWLCLLRTQLLFSFSFLLPYRGSAALLFLLCSLDLHDTPRFSAHTAALSQLFEVGSEQASRLSGKTLWKMVSAVCWAVRCRSGDWAQSGLWNTSRHFLWMVHSGFCRLSVVCGWERLNAWVFSLFLFPCLFSTRSISPSHCRRQVIIQGPGRVWYVWENGEMKPGVVAISYKNIQWLYSYQVFYRVFVVVVVLFSCFEHCGRW